MPAESDDDLLTTVQAAPVVRFSPRTLERMRREDRGPPYRMHGRYIFYVRGELKSWSKAQTRQPGSRNQQLPLPLVFPEVPPPPPSPLPPASSPEAEPPSIAPT